MIALLREMRDDMKGFRAALESNHAPYEQFPVNANTLTNASETDPIKFLQEEIKQAAHEVFYQEPKADDVVLIDQAKDILTIYQSNPNFKYLLSLSCILGWPRTNLNSFILLCNSAFVSKVVQSLRTRLRRLRSQFKLERFAGLIDRCEHDPYRVQSVCVLSS